jgi:hypothetical protein
VLPTVDLEVVLGSVVELPQKDCCVNNPQGAAHANMSACRQRHLLAGYCLNLNRGQAGVRDLIRTDIGRFSELGAHRYASDLAEVLKQFNLAHPEPTASC